MNLPIILSHIGGLLPVDLYANRDEEVLAIWRRGIAAVVACPNVTINLGGIGMSRGGKLRSCGRPTFLRADHGFFNPWSASDDAAVNLSQDARACGSRGAGKEVDANSGQIRGRERRLESLISHQSRFTRTGQKHIKLNQVLIGKSVRGIVGDCQRVV